MDGGKPQVEEVLADLRRIRDETRAETRPPLPALERLARRHGARYTYTYVVDRLTNWVDMDAGDATLTLLSLTTDSNGLSLAERRVRAADILEVDPSAFPGQEEERLLRLAAEYLMSRIGGAGRDVTSRVAAEPPTTLDRIVDKLSVQQYLFVIGIVFLLAGALTVVAQTGGLLQAFTILCGAAVFLAALAIRRSTEPPAHPAPKRGPMELHGPQRPLGEPDTFMLERQLKAARRTLGFIELQLAHFPEGAVPVTLQMDREAKQDEIRSLEDKLRAASHGESHNES
jgi:hypothetical protein